MTTINVAATRVVRLNWANWSAVCALVPGLVSRENQSRNVEYYHDHCNENLASCPSQIESEQVALVPGPYLQLDVPAAISAVQHDEMGWPQTAYHGDWLALLPSGKVLVIPSADGVSIASERRVITVDVEGMTDVEVSTLKALFLERAGVLVEKPDAFVFNAADFPLYSTWKHRNGSCYVIYDITNCDDVVSNPAYPPTIHYVNAHNGKKYSGFARDWNRRMTRVAGVI